jgi:predicted nucleotidyltransferase
MTMRDEVNNALNNIEKEVDCRVLFACESGSRAWGFGSPDSDYDVRFVYVKPLEWYLKLEKTSDTIDQMLAHDLDVSGWDLQKTLKLFAGCNLALNEWLLSPVVYFQDNEFIDGLRPLIPKYFNSIKGIHHYRGIAKSTLAVNSIDEPIKIKKLFYILRPLLAVQWIKSFDTQPPTEFLKIVQELELSFETQSCINELLDIKSRAVEGELINAPQRLKILIKELMDKSLEWEENAVNKAERDWEPLNKIALKFINA